LPLGELPQGLALTRFTLTVLSAWFDIPERSRVEQSFGAATTLITLEMSCQAYMPGCLIGFYIRTGEFYRV
jgi:hypothetical protein